VATTAVATTAVATTEVGTAAVVGGGGSSGGYFSPQPTSGAPPAVNPLASITEPTLAGSPCTYTNLDVGASAAVNLSPASTAGG
jgi:hypothetical protein